VWACRRRRCCCCCCRLAGTVDEIISFLVGRIESSMRELLDTDLALFVLLLLLLLSPCRHS
jgi:hypothetical protein